MPQRDTGRTLLISSTHGTSTNVTTDSRQLAENMKPSTMAACVALQRHKRQRQQCVAFRVARPREWQLTNTQRGRAQRLQQQQEQGCRPHLRTKMFRLRLMESLTLVVSADRRDEISPARKHDQMQQRGE